MANARTENKTFIRYLPLGNRVSPRLNNFSYTYLDGLALPLGMKVRTCIYDTERRCRQRLTPDRGITARRLFASHGSGRSGSATMVARVAAWNRHEDADFQEKRDVKLDIARV